MTLFLLIGSGDSDDIDIKCFEPEDIDIKGSGSNEIADYFFWLDSEEFSSTSSVFFKLLCILGYESQLYDDISIATVYYRLAIDAASELSGFEVKLTVLFPLTYYFASDC